MTITELFSPSFETARASATLAVNMLVQSSLIIALGLLAARLLRNHGAAVQATVLRVTLVAVMACPLASWTLAAAGVSGFGIELPRAGTLAVAPRTEVEAVLPMAASVVVEEVPNDSISADPNVAVVETAQPRGPGMPFPNSHTLMAAESAQHPAPAAADLATVAEPKTKTSISQPESAADRARHSSQVAWVYGVVGSTWLCGAILLLTRILLASVVVLRGRVRAAAADAKIASLCQSLAHAIGIRTPPIRVSRHIRSPCLVGVFRPAILLPATMNSVNRDVLVHELAHLRRQDCLWQLLSRMMSAALWFQPLSWWLSRQLEQTADDVADDFVVQFGSDRADYARRLVDIAERYQPEWSAACVGAGIASFKSSLAKRVVRILDTSRSLSTRTGLAALVAIILLGAACTLAVGLLGAGTVHAKPAETSNESEGQEQKSTTADRETTAEVTDEVTCSGRILDPAGQPVAGARVYLAYYSKEPLQPLVRATSNADGRFAFSADRESLGSAAADAQIVAVADGYGLDWQELFDDANQARRLELHLVPDVPIEGRIIDIEGKPVAAATVNVQSIRTTPDNNLDALLRAWEKDREPHLRLSARDQLVTKRLLWSRAIELPSIKTDADGRFRLTGLGKDRWLNLTVTGSGIGSSFCTVLARPPDEVQSLVKNGSFEPTYGTQFEHAVPPGRAIIGSIREKGTGKPVADAYVYSEGVETTTDTQGHYRLEGVGKAERYWVGAKTDSHFSSGINAEDTAGLDPITVDLELEKGIALHVRLRDKSTGQPIRGEFAYYGAIGNENVEGTEFASQPYVGTRGGTESDGSGTMVVFPGPGYLCVRASEDRYLPDYPGDAKEARPFQQIQAIPNPFEVGIFHNVVEINPQEGKSDTCELEVELDPGGTCAGRVTGPNGQPLDDVIFAGKTPIRPWAGPGYETLPSPDFEVLALSPGVPRTVLLIHRDSKLAKAIDVTAGSPPVAVSLEAVGAVAGQVVDAAGNPRNNITVHLQIRGHESLGGYGLPSPPLGSLAHTLFGNDEMREQVLHPSAKVDAAGKFRIDGLISGLTYDLYAHAGRVFGKLAADVKCVPRKSMDIGAVRIRPITRTAEQTNGTKQAATKTQFQQGGSTKEAAGTAQGSSGPLESAERAKRSSVPTEATKPRRVTGTVLDPDGKPLTGASVFVGLGDRGGDSNGVRVADSLEAKSGPDGRFEVDYRQRDFFENPESVPKMMWDRLDGAVYVVASAPGFGPGWIRGVDSDVGESLTIRLVPDTPIEGQLVTLEGTPAANARVRLESIQAAPDNNVQPWLDSLRAGTNMWKASVDHKHQNIRPNVFRMPEQFTTDEDGRFRIKGIGSDRIVRLFVEGPSVARTVFRVVARETEPLPTNLPSAEMDGDQVYGAKFKRIVAPSQPIAGVLRDAETGTPLAGVTIESYQFAGSNLMGVRTNLLRAYTDDAGRFRLEGMPKGRGNRLLAVPHDNQPYFMHEIPIPETEGLDPITVEVEMHRGIWITGKVIDKVTRAPVMASLKYLPFLSNEYAERLPEFTTIGNGQVDGGLGYQHRYVTAPDGSFRLVGLPGRAVVGAETMSKHRHGAGSEKIDGKDDDGRLPTYTNPLRASKTWPNVMVEINPAQDADSISVTLEAEPGSDSKIIVTDLQGKPITGYRVSGQMSSSQWGDPIEQPSFVVTGLAPAETRTLLIVHDERRLGKAIRITNEKRELTVKLAPCASVRGRLVDVDGDPVARATLRAFTEPNEDFNPYLPPITTDDQGLFEFAAVPVGSEYRVQVRPLKGRTRTDAMKFAPRAGETILLGDVVLRSRSQVLPRRTAQNAAAATRTETDAEPDLRAIPQPDAATNARPARRIRGRVVDPDGKPVAGAAISVPEMLRNPPQSPDDMGLKQEASTDQDGRFQIRTTFAGFPDGIKTVPVIAFAKGFGIAWLNLPVGEDAEDVTLRLAKDEPVRGRVVDTEGRPVADARIDVTGLLQEPSGSLDGFLEAWKNDWNIAPMRADQVYAVLNGFSGTKSDTNGKFEIRGIGLERVAYVEMRHPQIASTRVWVVNRPGLDTKPYNNAAQLRLPAEVRRAGMVPLLLAPKFSHVVEAGRTIEGVVYVGKDREPVAGAVVATVLGYGMGASDMTDERGAYAIHGVGLQDPHFVMVRPPEESALLQRTLSSPLAAGKGTVKIDVELTRGVVLTGRVADPSTGQGISAGIRVAPLPSNKYFDDPLYDVYKRNRQQSSTKADGTFRIVTIPGPSVVMAQVRYQEKMGGQDVTPFRQASFSAEDEKHVPLTVNGNDRYFTMADGSIETLRLQNAAKYVDLRPDGEAAHVDLSLDRGKKVEIEIHDDTGNPITGVFAAGLTEHWPYTFRLQESRSTVYALGEDRPRTLLLLHPERKLAGSVMLKGDEISPIIVKLAPAGSIAGRALDDGAPLGNAKVVVNFVNDVAKELYRFSDLKNAQPTTDAEGRFRVENIVPGERFVVDFKEGDSYFRANLKRDELTVDSGMVRDYNDLKIRKLR